MVPAISWPKMRGAECEPEWIFFRSVPQMPQVSMRTSTSPGPISGTGTVSTRTSFTPWYTAARCVRGTCPGLRSMFCFCDCGAHRGLSIPISSAMAAHRFSPASFACLAELRQPAPGARPGCDVGNEARGRELARRCHEWVHIRQILIQRIADCLDRAKTEAVRQRQARERCSFHIDRDCAVVGACQPVLLFAHGHARRGEQQAACALGGEHLAGIQVAHHACANDGAGCKLFPQRAGSSPTESSCTGSHTCRARANARVAAAAPMPPQNAMMGPEGCCQPSTPSRVSSAAQLRTSGFNSPGIAAMMTTASFTRGARMVEHSRWQRTTPSRYVARDRPASP